MKKIYAACYDSLHVFNDMNEAKNFFEICYYGSEGAEKERYASIYFDLTNNNVLATDGVSNYCNCITIHNNEERENIKLDKYMSFNDAIKYYESNYVKEQNDEFVL